jgi:hypothetical protein
VTLKTTVDKLTKAEALSALLCDHERDWLHDARRAHELLAQRDQLIADSCATDTAIRELCRKVLGDAVDGDSVAVPPVEDLVERVVDELVELESELAGVRPHLATVLEHAERCRLGPVEVEAFRNLLTRCQ